MNNPEYILTDVMEEVVTATKDALELPYLYYEYGTVKELNAKIAVYNNSPADRHKFFPFVWLEEPFDVIRDESVPQGFYGRVEGANIFICMSSAENDTAKDRMTKTFKPIIFPIYREILKQLEIHTALSTIPGRLVGIPHRVAKRYRFAGFDTLVDCSVLRNCQLLIYDNPNCQTFINF